MSNEKTPELHCYLFWLDIFLSIREEQTCVPGLDEILTLQSLRPELSKRMYHSLCQLTKKNWKKWNISNDLKIILSTSKRFRKECKAWKSNAHWNQNWNCNPEESSNSWSCQACIHLDDGEKCIWYHTVHESGLVRYMTIVNNWSSTWLTIVHKSGWVTNPMSLSSLLFTTNNINMNKMHEVLFVFVLFVCILVIISVVVPINHLITIQVNSLQKKQVQSGLLAVLPFHKMTKTKTKTD